MTECSAAMADDRTHHVKFRCHPNFRNEGPWYDWAIVRFAQEGGATNQEDSTTQVPKDCVPCKILAFFEDGTTNEIKALVHGCRFRDRDGDLNRDTCLIEFWNLAYDHTVITQQRPGGGTLRGQQCYIPCLYVVSLSSFHARCFVVDTNPGVHERLNKQNEVDRHCVMLVRDRSEWPDIFT